jgi:hypothetical protein
VINPADGGTQSVLDRYAEQIGSSIERDGFFVRVPAGKQYVYCPDRLVWLISRRLRFIDLMKLPKS